MGWITAVQGIEGGDGPEVVAIGDDPRERWASQPLLKDQSGEVSREHGCDGVNKGELLLGYE